MADLPDWYTQIQETEVEAYALRHGADAAKPASPLAGDVYLASDTKKLYICVTDGAWTGFDASILVQGILTLYADLVGGGFEITGIKDPTAAQSAATRAYVLTQKALCLLLTGGTMSGIIAMGGYKITGVGAGVLPGDAARLAEVAIVDAKLNDISYSGPAYALDTVYQNTSGKIIRVVVSADCRVSAADGDLTGISRITAYTNSANPPTTIVGRGGLTNVFVHGLSVENNYIEAEGFVCFSVIPDHYYKVTTLIANDGVAPVLNYWREWTEH